MRRLSINAGLDTNDVKPEVLFNERGVELVNYLLKHPPDEAIHASELENLVDGSPMIDGAGAVETEQWRGGDIGHVATALVEATGKKLTGELGTILKKKLAEQREIRDDESLSLEQREAAEQQIDELLKAHSRGGKAVSGAQKAVDRVRKAIKALTKELRTAELSKGQPNEVLRAFGEHLDQHLWLPSMGGRGRAGAAGRPGCFTYERPKGVIWRD